MNIKGEIFAKDNEFWSDYNKGRPQVPESFFNRIFGYHEAKGAAFGVAHDVGAGNGPYVLKLKSRFEHVIVSDIVPENIQLARERLRTLVTGEGLGFRVAKVEDANDIAPGSVDLVFAANMLHFADQESAMNAIATQLRSGGTFACSLFGPARFDNAGLQDLWTRISFEGGRQLLKEVDNPIETIQVMCRTQDKYNVAPLDPNNFLPGAQRLHLNMSQGGIQGLLPPEEAHQNKEPNHTSSTDVEIYEDDEQWTFEKDLEGIREHFSSFPFISRHVDAFKDLFQELDAYGGWKMCYRILSCEINIGYAPLNFGFSPASTRCT